VIYLYTTLLCCIVYLLSLLMFLCSDGTSVHVNACDNSFDVTVVKDVTENRSVCFQLSGVKLLPINCYCQQVSSDHTFHLRLELKEIIAEDVDEKRESVDDHIADAEAMHSEPFYCRCRKCGDIILSRLL